jgi:putative nucleotidyltransferase with HDIG domain
MRIFWSLLLLVVLASAIPTALVTVVLARQRGGLDGLPLAAVGASLALAVVLSTLVARGVTRPLNECVRGALEIARGRFGCQVRVSTGNEIGDLAYTFNHMSRELAAYDAENRRLIEALGRGYLDTIRSLAGAIDAKDPYTRGHAQRVAELAVAIGREMGLDAEALQALEHGGILHDIGKIGIPDPILQKRTPLTPEELALVHAHPAIGAEIVRGVAFLASALPAIRGHHERWDGGGYPDRLAGEAIPLVARIVNAADTWDACTSNRPYQAALAPAEVVAILAGLRGTQVDPAVHEALLSVLRRRGAAPHEATGFGLQASGARLERRSG